MPLVIRDTRGGGHSGLSTSVTVAVCVSSLVGTLTLGALAWIFIVRRRKITTIPTSTTTVSEPPTPVAHLPRKPEPAHIANLEKAQDQQTDPIPSPPPAYSPGLMKNSSTSSKKSTPTLNIDVERETDAATLPSPLRSASFNPSTKSISSRLSSRMSTSTRKLPRLMVVIALYVPSLNDELPIRLGETIRMIEEYEDEWCLAQRVGRTDERGVVPRFCLTERQEVIPRAGQRTSSILFQTSTFRK